MSTNVDTNKGSLSRRTLRLHKPVLSLDHITTSRTPKSSAQFSVFARLQARLLPHASPLATSTIHPDVPEKPPPQKYLKIRLVTWNMNESLPKGDLAALLGNVPPYHIDASSKVDLNIPGLTLDTDHPYHLVLVAGQECPTLMGLPLGLGGGIKWDKDREEEEKKKEKKDREDGKKKKEKGREKDREKDAVPTNPEPSPAPTPGTRTPSRHNHPHHATGWSSILEDYFSRGIGSIPGVRPDIIPPAVNSSLSLLKSPDRAGSPASVTVQGLANKDANWNLPPGGGEVPKMGPYELLVKERLMGIYLALYVHRDIRPLVEGVSQASVTAGLIGGRLGNKGGVAISLKLDGTTFLFLNAHLAAHEEKVALRIANLTKIKAELSIDDFLPADDERKVAEDPTDRFDHTFLCGDLNFRLDITRLHAEWLISQKKYAEAQEFDQLNKIMKGIGPHAFTGFSEAPINFAPTFKYDILHTLRGSKRSRKGNIRGRRVLSEVGEQDGDDLESSSVLPGDNNREGADNDSMESSTYRSRRDEDKGSSSSSSSDGESIGERDQSIVDVAKVVAAKIKKRKWYAAAFKSPSSLPPGSVVAVSPNSIPPSSASKVSIGRATSVAKTGAGSREAVEAESLNRGDSSSQRKLQNALHDRSQTIIAPPLGSRASTSMDILRKGADHLLEQTSLMRSISSTSGVGSKTTLKDSVNEAGLDVQDMGVYDTSSKQRVPSWCDRILFKTTIDIPPPTPIQEEPAGALSGSQELSEQSPPPHRRMTPMKEFFQQAFRPKSRSGSTTTTSVNSASGANAEPRKHSATKAPSTGGVPAKRASFPQANGTPLQIVTSVAHEQMDSPVAISRSGSTPPSSGVPIPDGKDAPAHMTRRTTSPNTPRAGSGGMSSLRVHTKRRRSLSATLPHTSEPVELSGRMIPASASMPPVLPLEYTDGSIVKEEPDYAPAKADATPVSGGGVRVIRRVFSFLSGPFGQSPMANATPGTGQSTVVYGLPPKVYKRGEVACLEYATLSDREMRRLEGRSDHRPVIGQFAVYL